MENLAFAEREYFVDSTMLDINGCLTAAQILRMFQQTGMDHLDKTKHGYDIMNEEGVAFLLSKSNINVMRPAYYGDILYSQTCLPKISGIFYQRYFRLMTPDYETVADGCTLWTLVDLERRTIIRPNHTDNSYMPPFEAFSVTAEPPKTVELPEDMELIGTHTVTYSDCDQYGHMNNTKYVEVILNTLKDFMKGTRVNTLEMCYSHEAPLNSELSIYHAKEQSFGGMQFFDVKNGEKSCFSANVSFTPLLKRRIM